MQKPQAKKIDYYHERHGDRRYDPYYWMNNREDPDLLSYLEEENRHTEAGFSSGDNYREQLYQEITGRIPQEDRSAPFRKGEFYYYARFHPGQEHPVWCRSLTEDGAGEEVILDVDKLSAGHAYYHVALWRLSPDGRYIAFAEDTLSRRKYDIRIRDLETGKITSPVAGNTSGAFAWAGDSRRIFFAERDETLRPSKILLYDPDTKESFQLIYEESDPVFYADVYPSKAGDFIFIDSQSTLTSEVRFIPAHQVEMRPRLIQERIRGLEYHVESIGESFIIRTNHQAMNFRLVQAPVNNPGIDNWTELYPHDEATLLEAFDLNRQSIFMQVRSGGLPMIRVLRHSGEFWLDIPADEEAYTLSLGRNEYFESAMIRFVYSSLTTPAITYEMDPVSGIRRMIKQDQVKGGFSAEEYHTHRVFASAADGTLIPISLVSRRDIDPNGIRPGLLYAYGSYGIIVEPFFRSHIISLLDRGFIYAIAHIRGGEDMGRQWYEDGKLLKKMNTFTDFIACAGHLCNEGIVSEGHLYAMGGSAGGLLMGAVINIRPDLFRGVIAAVPFVDVVTTMLDDTIPLTTGEYDEWGDPNDPVYYQYMKGYSPYDNVQELDYPALLVISGLHDSQVQYWEPTKWVARLREMNGGSKPVFLHTNLLFGHSGAAGRFERYKDIAMEYTFLLMLEGSA